MKKTNGSSYAIFSNWIFAFNISFKTSEATSELEFKKIFLKVGQVQAITFFIPRHCRATGNVLQYVFQCLFLENTVTLDQLRGGALTKPQGAGRTVSLWAETKHLCQRMRHPHSPPLLVLTFLPSLRKPFTPISQLYFI